MGGSCLRLSPLSLPRLLYAICSTLTAAAELTLQTWKLVEGQIAARTVVRKKTKGMLLSIEG